MKPSYLALAFLIMVATVIALRARAEPAGPPGPGVYPDADLTPGAVDPTATTQKLCTPGYTATVRNVTVTERREVFRRYGIDWGKHAGYEVDHFVSLELAGSNDISNLWPQPYDGVPYTARDKDEVENALHRAICQGKLTINEAQQMIREDWVAIYLLCCQKQTRDPDWPSPGAAASARKKQ